MVSIFKINFAIDKKSIKRLKRQRKAGNVLKIFWFQYRLAYLLHIINFIVLKELLYRRCVNDS
jgi:hypothetical protein